MRKFIIIVLLTICLAVALFAWQAISFLSSSGQAYRTEVIFEVPTGSVFYRVADELEKQALVTDARKFSLMAKLLGKTTRLRVGEYRLHTEMRPREILNMLTSGQSITYALTIPEGFNVYEIRDQLNSMWPNRGDEFMQVVHNREFIKRLTGEDMASLEGYLFPETYSLTKYTPVETLVRRMYDYFQEAIATVNANVKVKLPIHEQVTLASVIEKETGAAGERQLISSVFHNRLRKGMKLQSDPTIIYGLAVESGAINKNITKADILKPTPYNTYTVKALPVGPIANPGREALLAAVTPAESDYLFFVSRNDGTHFFSETYEKHAKAVRDFQLNRKMREGRSWRDLNKNQK